MSKLRITDGKGFYFGFSNGWGVSVQFGPGNYADNYDMRIGYDDIESGKLGSNVAEIAIITPEHELFSHPDFDGDTVAGYQSTEDIMKWLKFAMEQKIEKPVDTNETTD